MQRYFLDEASLTLDQVVTLPPDIFKHAITVMRLKPGQQFEFVTNDQKVNVMTVTTVGKKTAQAQVSEITAHQVEMPVEVTLLCGVSKNDKKADLIIEKGTELGANHFIFFNADYSIGKWDEKKQAKKLERLRKKALSAAEQSHRVRVPTVDYIAKLSDIDWPAAAAKVVAYEESAKVDETSNLSQVFQSLKANPRPLFALFGPEGGISPKEIAYLTRLGFVSCGLGPRIMRTETAPLYFLASLSFVLELL